MEEKDISVKRLISNLFDKVSEDFDASGPRYFAYFGERLVKFAGINEDQRILDIASGKGASLLPAVQKVGQNGDVIGIDISKGMVCKTNLEIRRRDIQNARVMVMDAEKLEFADERFDHVLCGFGIFFFPNYKAALKEFKRVLKSDGRFSFTTFLNKRDERFRWYGELVDKYLVGAEGKIQDYDGPAFDTEETLYEILNEAGFKNIKVISEEKTFEYKNEREWWDKLWTHGGIRVLEAIPKERLEDFRTEVFAKLKKMKKSEGITAAMSVLYASGEK
ncbi:MAG: class I SAM-dependent methyltransferase [Bacillota bacterium]|nr:class I SAM-dependent methyltransferase [Bacillota bacterium]